MSTQILSPMPGKIIELLIKEGDTVVDGQELIIVEAMKMENPICATCNGTIKELTIALDEQVEAKQLLLVIE